MTYPKVDFLPDEASATTGNAGPGGVGAGPPVPARTGD